MRLTMRWMLLLVVLAPAGAAGETGPAPLRYQVSPGQVFAHQLSLQAKIQFQQIQGVKLPPQLADGLDLSASGRLASIVVAPDEEGFRVLQKATFQARLPGQGVTPPRSGDFQFVLTPTGPRLSSFPNLTGVGANPIELAGMQAALFTRLPEQAVKPGDTWTHEIRPTAPNAPPITLRAVARLLRFEEAEGRLCARVETRYSVPQQSLSLPDGATAALSVTGVDTTLCDRQTGIPVRSFARLQFGVRLADRNSSGTIRLEVTMNTRQVAPTQAEIATAKAAVTRAGWQVANRAGTDAPAQPAGTALSGGGAPVVVPPATAAPKPPVPSVRLVSPRMGDRVTSPCLVHAEVSEDTEAVLAVFLVDGRRVAAVNTTPFHYRIPAEDLPAGVHTIGVEVYGTHQTPLAKASTRVRVPE